MKVDKRNPRHWLYLAQFAINVTIALLVRPFRHRGQKKRVILYGHKLSGNLLAIHQALRASHALDVDVQFLTMDPDYHRELLVHGESSVLATSPACVAMLAHADAMITDHGLHVLLPLLWFTSIKFIDVWHGIPFKGFDADDFRVQHRYDEVWVASPLQRQLYIDKFGFDPDIVHVTGYGRTDQLVRREGDIDAIKCKLGLDPTTCGKLVLFAPTWQQDARNRSLLPFGLNADDFLSVLSALAVRNGATVLLRTHINSGTAPLHGRERVVPVPFARYPETEALLLASDVLICDWSSIAFDYLLLDRPTIFLDVPAPFRKGFSLGEDYRFGEIVPDLESMLDALQSSLDDRGDYAQRFDVRAATVRRAVYGDSADGHASARCIARLQAALGTGAAASS